MFELADLYILDYDICYGQTCHTEVVLAFQIL